MSFLSRWQQRKADVAQEEQDAQALETQHAEAEEVAESGPSAEATAAEAAESQQTGAQAEQAEATEEAPLPDPETIEQGGSFADYLKPGVDPTQRKEALRALWKQPQYNIRDGLCEYDLDYAAQPKLSAAVAAEVAKSVFRHVTEAVEQVDKAVAKQQQLEDNSASEAVKEPQLAQAATAETPSELPNIREGIGQNDPQEAGKPDKPRSEA
ncbi:DUF3306 domain-containing protein [Marinobacter hydrocarbonoclasticus]|nr:DUF3306 domain-containing protein [Marinobacter nauticus]